MRQAEVSPEETESAGRLVLDRLAAGRPPSLAVVAGSGLSGLRDLGREVATVDYADIPILGETSVEGHAGRMLLLETPQGQILCLLGRRHLYEGIAPGAAGLLMRLVAWLGVQRVLLTNAAGGLSTHLHPGDLMLIDDHINWTFRNPLRGSCNGAVDARSPELARPYDQPMQERLLRAATEQGIELKRGVYAAVTGPSYETPAEVRMLQGMGADAVGMSTVPEVLVARRAGMRVAAISLISNTHVHAHPPATHEEVLAMGRRGVAKLGPLVTALIED